MSTTHLYRSRNDRKIAGVAGGMAAYFGVDSSVIRLVWLLAILFGGAGALAYIIAWIVIPEEKPFAYHEQEPEEVPVSTEPQTDSSRSINFLGILFIASGLFFLVKQFLPMGLGRFFWPFILIGFGIFLLIPRK